MEIDPLVSIDPKARAGKPPCGECHLRPGENCDVCSARQPTAIEADLRTKLADQQRVLGQVAAALEDHAPDCLWCKNGIPLVERNGTQWHEANGKLGSCYRGSQIRVALALPDVAEALAAWRKEQGQ